MIQLLIRYYTPGKINAVATSSSEHILVFRFSAMGDVALTVPVIKQLHANYPKLSITIVSQEKFRPLFENLGGVNFYAADIYGKHSGVFGLFRLFQELRRKNKFTAVADLHDVIRTRILRFYFKISGYKIVVIDKGRREKKELIRKKNKDLRPLKSTLQRYTEVFEVAAYPFIFNNKAEKKVLPVTNKEIDLLVKENKIRIGIAAFAMHPEKMYPLEKMEAVVKYFSEKNYTIFLFGGGKTEYELMQQWEKKYQGLVNTIGRFSFSDELVLISHLEGIISMDSANMHLASLYGVPVISIWGATHPFAGFYGFGQSPDNIVQADLFCRPCSVFGNKTCYRGDLACLKMIEPQKIIDKTEEILNQQ